MLVAGASTVMRTGFRRSDVLFRTLGEASVLTTAGHRVLVLTTDLPARGSAALAAVAAARGVTLVDALELGATGVGAPAGGLRGGRPARTRRRAPARPLTARGRRLPSPKTEITEIVTGAAIAGAADRRRGVWPSARRRQRGGRRCGSACRTPTRGGQHRQEFAAAWANGQAFLAAEQGLRGRPPSLVEWKGPTQAPGDEVVPADLRVDHVWLISCKYLSKVLANAAPSRLFERAWPAGRPPEPPATGTPRSRPTPTRRCSRSCAASSAPARRCRRTPPTSRPRHRAELRAYLDAGWSPDAQAAYRALAVEVGKVSADRWRRTLAKRTEAEAVLWRLLRIGSAPYFVLGAQRDRSLRLRVMTPWDWRQAYELKRMDVWGDDAGQPQVRWQAIVREQGHAARSTPSTVTSRSAGATAASASPPRPRPTSTPPTTESPAT